MKFEDLNIIGPILLALEEKGYKVPTPIQEATIGNVLMKKDLLACAQTGTGKTAAFAIPILQNLYVGNSDKRAIKALVLTPTRELAIQIRDNFREYGKHTNLKCSVIFGGINQRSQVEVLKKGVDILIATPGRLLDLINQRHAKLNEIEYLVLDEADRMLDMGFVNDIRRVVSHTPKSRTTLLFSATMPDEIEALAQDFLKDPIRVAVSPVASTVEKVKQLVYYVDKNNKPVLLVELLRDKAVESAIVFTRTKHGANKLEKILTNSNIPCRAIHGNKSQNSREETLRSFKKGEIKVLIATDIASRGIDIKGLSHVFNYDVPNVPEDYVHRIGRTARAGHEGIAISLCDFSEKPYIKSIERLTNQPITIVFDHDYPIVVNQVEPVSPPQKKFVSNKSIVKSHKPNKSNYTMTESGHRGNRRRKEKKYRRDY